MMPSVQDHPEYLTPAEVARRFGVSASTVSQWDRDGRLTAVRTPGGHRRFLADDVDRLAAEVA